MNNSSISNARLFRLAISLFVFSALVSAAVFVMILAGGEAEYTGWGFRGFPSLFSIPFSITGFIILSRLPRHGVGWVLLAFGLVSSIQGLLFEYMLYSLVLFPDLLPGGLQVAWILEWYWVFIIYLISLILVIFPSGSPPSSRWWRYIWLMTTLMALFAVLMSLTPGPMESSFVALENPFGWEVLRPMEEMAIAGTGLVMGFCFGLPVIGLVARFRGASGIERQQYKWFVYAALINLVTSIFSAPSDQVLVQLFFLFSILLLPVAIAVAVLRYRLFDIDIIIRRTLSYGVLTAVLAFSYFGGVVVLQNLFGRLAGDPDSPIITVVTTLAIAALFNPLRTRIQDFIDRRFYRSKYDAERTLQRFSAAARDEVDLDNLAGAMLAAVAESVQPDYNSLWLKPIENLSTPGRRD